MERRDRFIEWLARLVSDGVVKEDEALSLLKGFDDGLFEWDEPLPLWNAIIQSVDDRKMAAGMMMAMLAQRNLTIGPLANPTSALRPAMLDQLQSTYKTKNAVMAKRLAEGRMTLQEWQRVMLATLEKHHTVAFMFATGRTEIAPAEAKQLLATLQVQSAYMSRFADSLAYKKASEAAIGARSALYSNAVRETFWRANEEDFLKQPQGGGWLLRWVSRDDRMVCTKCLPRHGKLYMPGTNHPVPGAPFGCYGDCRCKLEWVQDAKTWRMMNESPDLEFDYDE